MSFDSVFSAMAQKPVAAIAALLAMAVLALGAALGFMFKKLMEAHDRIEAAKDQNAATALQVLPVASQLSQSVQSVDRMLSTIERLSHGVDRSKT